MQFSGPIIINKLLNFLNKENSKDNLFEGIYYVTILVICFLLRTIIMQHGMSFININSSRVLSCVNNLIYRKILKLSSSSKKYLEAGKIMNHISVDVTAIFSFAVMNAFAISTPIMIFFGIIMLIW